MRQTLLITIMTAFAIAVPAGSPASAETVMLGDQTCFQGYDHNANLTDYTVCIGDGAGGGQHYGGTQNVLIGYSAGYCLDGSSNNTAVGAKASEGVSHTPTWSDCSPYVTGASNTSVGYSAGRLLSTGRENVFVGYSAGYYGLSGNYNVGVGAYAAQALTIGPGEDNTSVGGFAGWQNAGSDNVFVGYEAGANSSTGTRNVFLGNNAGSLNSDGAYNIFIGALAGKGETGSNRLYIASTATTTPLIYGELDNMRLTVYGSLTTTSSATLSDERLKKDVLPLDGCLDKVRQMEGVTYSMRVDEYPARGLPRQRQSGFIAQDLKKVLPEVVHTDGRGYESISYGNMVPVLVEAIREQETGAGRRDEAIADMRERISLLRGMIRGFGESAGGRHAGMEVADR